MDKAILLAVAASVCTAAASLCQRKGARNTQTAGFGAGLVVRLARQPVWLLGIASMISGFIFQITALRFGGLALVQPILAAELLFVYGYLAVAGKRRVTRRDWLAAAAMSAGIGLFLRLASPSGGRLHAPGSSWLLAGLVTAGVVLAALAVSSGLGNRPGAARSRRTSVLGAATGISWGFMAAVIKELSSHLGAGPGAVLSTWSLYVLIAAGAATMLLASHALAAGPLAASQPGFTILDPFWASLLGVFLFGEHIRTGAMDLAGQALALAVVITGAAALSRSNLIAGENGHPKDPPETGSCRTSQQRALRPDVAILTDGTIPRLGSRRSGPGRITRPVREIKTLIPNGPWPNHNAGCGLAAPTSLCPPAGPGRPGLSQRRSADGRMQDSAPHVASPESSGQIRAVPPWAALEHEHCAVVAAHNIQLRVS